MHLHDAPHEFVVKGKFIKKSLRKPVVGGFHRTRLRLQS
jgi:hypothetical protein